MKENIPMNLICYNVGEGYLCKEKCFFYIQTALVVSLRNTCNIPLISQRYDMRINYKEKV